MYSDRLVFSQVMDHLSMKTFHRYVQRYQRTFDFLTNHFAVSAPTLTRHETSGTQQT